MALKYVDDVPAARPAPERLAKARAILSEASERVGAEYRPPRDLPMPKAVTEAVTPSRGFDRVTYQREYMRGWRARKKGGGEGR
jgi:hypothetical protein